MSRVTAIVFVALSLGLGWAIRGHFGHEWGACWAGAIAAAAVLVAARRDDWARRMPVLVALGGIGWAVGGMMSYGIVVGYSVLYLVFSHLKKGFFVRSPGFQPEQCFYWVCLAAIVGIWLVRGRGAVSRPPVMERPETGRRWIAIVSIFLALLALMTLVSVNVHEGLPGAHSRF
ncbi:MAG: hypothetical protein ABIP48_27295 [Planctomycetota bacterium]